MTYPFNNHRPKFNDAFGSGTILDLELCSEDNPQSNPDCLVKFSNDFYATDDDGDTVSYLIVPPSLIFSIRDKTDLASLYYSGVGISEQTSLPLLIQVTLKIPTIN